MFSIFNRETGSLEQHKLQFIPDDVNAKKDSRPGEAFFKLKSKLGKKIDEKRREMIAKRLEEEKQRKLEAESDEEEEEFEEYSDCESNKEAPVDINSEEEIDENPKNTVIDFEADEDEAENSDASSEAENECDNDDESSAGEDSNSINDIEKQQKQNRRRIITVENDSDDEMANGKSNFVKKYLHFGCFNFCYFRNFSSKRT